MPAINLHQALSIFVAKPLAGNDLNLYFVAPPGNPLSRMITDLRAKRQVKVLFTGHRGNGKSTALNYLSTQLQNEFFIVSFSVSTDLGGYDIHYADLLLVMAAKLLERATDEKLFPKGIVELVRADLLDDVKRWFEKHIEGLQFIPSSTEKSLTAQVNYLAIQLEAKVGTEVETRQTLRARVAMYLAELIERIRYLIDEMERKGGRRVLFIVEDIDKLDLANARDLFLEHARTLTAPAASIIYTFPVALRYSVDFTQIMANFGKRYVWPNVRLYDHQGIPDAQGRDILEEIFYRRLDRKLITTDALEQLIAASGGLIGTLIRLGDLAAGYALAENREQIETPDVIQAIAEIRGDFKVMLRQQDYDVLRQQLAGEPLRNEDAVREALYTGMLLEYQNNDPWMDVNPIVRPLIERGQNGSRA